MISDDIEETARLKLQSKLEEILGSSNVYYQPPETVKMTYPCIVFSLQDIPTQYSGDKITHYTFVYSVIYISRKSVSDTRIKILNNIPKSKFNRRYIYDTLYHDEFTIRV